MVLLINVVIGQACFALVIVFRLYFSWYYVQFTFVGFRVCQSLYASQQDYWNYYFFHELVG